MCGIVGYIGKGRSLQMIVDGLKRLEYRGYDSAGVAFLNGKGLDVYKTKGKLWDLQKILPDPLPSVRIGLGHTRWATHGVPSAENAHPHAAGGIAVVHNGIIENYRELRAELEAEGRTFLSQTDTEVVPHLIARSVRQGRPLLSSIQQAVQRLRGSYALGILCEKCPDMLIAIRKGSPLVLGIGDGEFFFASDIPAILPYTRRVLFMEDGQLCALTSEGMEILDQESNEAVPAADRVVTIEWTPAMAEKGGHDHFMHKEIHEQPQAIMNTLGEWIDDPPSVLNKLGMDAHRMAGLRRLHLTACGTSYHAALVGKYMIERLARIPVSVDIASEYRYRDPIIEAGTLFISITQSGETADTLAAQREAKKNGAMTLTICNVVGSTSTREADGVLYTRGGPEIGVASTKAFTAQMAALCIFGIAAGMSKNRLTPDDAVQLIAGLKEIPALVQEACNRDREIKELAHTLLDAKSALYLGRGIHYPIALEGALKLKEISYIHAEGYAAGEMKHGPIALIDKNVPVIVVAPGNGLFEKTLSNIEEVKARGGRVIAVTDSPGSLMNKADDIIEVPACQPLLAPLVTVIPLQLLAYHVGVLKACDVDQPRNLAKSVTVE